MTRIVQHQIKIVEAPPQLPFEEAETQQRGGTGSNLRTGQDTLRQGRSDFKNAAGVRHLLDKDAGPITGCEE